MRIRDELISSSCAYPFTAEASPKEIIEGKLREQYEKVPYRMGKVIAVLDVKPSPYGKLELYINGPYLIVDFQARLRLSYLNQGDVLFGVSIETPKGLNVGLYDVVNVDTPINAIIRLDQHVNKANVIVDELTPGSYPQYMTKLAIYPKYAMISIGESKVDIDSIEPRLYPDVPYKKTAHMEHVDPLTGLTDVKRKHVIVSSIRKLFSITGEPEVLELGGKAPKEYKGEKVLIEFVELDSVAELLSQRQIDGTRAELVYSPAFPINLRVCAVVTFPLEFQDAYEGPSIKNFILRVEDYIAMKCNELASMDTVLGRAQKGPLIDEYKKRRQAIVSDWVD